MLKKFLTVVLTGAMLLCGLPATVMADNGNSIIANDETGILDPVLYEAILRQTDRNNDGILTVSEAEDCFSLHVRNGLVVTLQGIEYCKNINTLIITDSVVDNLEPLSALVQLSNLWIKGTYSDISPLAGLTELTTLNLPGSNISDISPLAGLTKLTELNLASCNLSDSDISVLADLTELITLSLGFNNIGDLSALANLVNLENLQLHNNNISDLSGLANLTELKILKLGDNNISDVSALANLVNLENLQLYNNNISNISALINMVKMEELSLYSNNISDISALVNMTELEYLAIDDNNISDVLPLAGLSNLENLWASLNQISDVSPLAGLTQLKVLKLSQNNISDISALANMTELEELALDDNNVSDVLPLAGLNKLMYLWASSNQISDVSPLAGLTQLNGLVLSWNNISDKSPLSALINLIFLNLEGNPCEDVAVPPTQEEQVRSFVERMYTIILGRDADPNGLNDWAAGLMEWRVDGAGIVNGFANSAEFEARNLSDEDFIKTLYLAVLNREADEAGLADWLRAFSLGYTRQQLIDGFVTSAEFIALCDSYGILAEITQKHLVTSFVERMYTVALDREADAAGLEYWVTKLMAGSTDGKTVVNGFVGSPEFAARGLNDEAFIKTLYRTILGREANEADVASWIAAIELGQTRTQIMNGFIESAEFAYLCDGYGISAILTQRDLVTNFVSRMYTVALNREADANGLNDWVTGLINGVIYGAQVADGFIMSAEFEARGLSNEAYVQTLYMTFFNREASAADVEGWVNAMTVYGQSRRDVMNGFINSAEFEALCNEYGIIRGSL